MRCANLLRLENHVAASNHVVWSDTPARYCLVLPEEGRLIKRYVWVCQVETEYLLNDMTVIYEPSPFEILPSQSIEPSYVPEDPVRFRDASLANHAADRLYGSLISEGWQLYVGEAPKHKQQ